MLMSFRFANHRSFRDEQQLNLMPVYGLDEQRTRSEEPVRTAGIFGANASGKSNCLHAFTFMRRMAVRSDKDVEPGVGIEREPFRLDAQCPSEPSRYVVDLLLNGVRHTYGFTIDDDVVAEEWLYHYPHKKKSVVFAREGQKYRWGDDSGRRSELKRISTITAPTALYLSTVARFGTSSREVDKEEPAPLHGVYRWFYGNRVRSRPGLRLGTFGRQWPSRKADQRVIVELLKAADVGIVDVSLKPDAAVTESILDELGIELPEQGLTPRRGPDDRRISRLQFLHRGFDSNTMLDFMDESTGTQQLLDLAIDASLILRSGATMTVDEIDASLHPILTARLISLFQSAATNPRGSQLIFTSHDAALIGTIDGEEILRRDEIWFTEKHEDGASVLYPLSDFKPRKDENRQRRYMNGNYGAVPNLSGYLFERALATREERDDEPARQ